MKRLSFALLIAIVLGILPRLVIAQDDPLRWDPVKQQVFLDSVSKKISSQRAWRIGQPSRLDEAKICTAAEKQPVCTNSESSPASEPVAGPAR